MRSALLAALLLAIAAPAAAQDRAEPDQVYDFEGELVDGTLEGPVGCWVPGRSARPTHTLIRARAHWIPELTQSVETL